MSANVTIPNSYQTPNIVVDKLYQYLHADEIVVLTYAVRHILGWRDKIADRRGFISLSMFEHGFTTKTGAVYGGCGLTRPKIARALKSLVQYGVMAKVGAATQDGQEWALTFDDSNAVQWEGLEQRRTASQKRAAKRISKAAKASAEKRKNDEGSTTVVPDEVVRQPYRGGYDSRTGGGTTVVHKQTYANTQQTHIPPSADIAEATKSQKNEKATGEFQAVLEIVVDSWFDGDWAQASWAGDITNMLIGRNEKKQYAAFNLQPGWTPQRVKAFASWIRLQGMEFPTKPAAIRRWCLKYIATQSDKRPATQFAPPDDDCPICGGTGIVQSAARVGEPGYGETRVCECRKIAQEVAS